jgi:GTP:adenosylcobinamide-phosphate guanylyltransferase
MTTGGLPAGLDALVLAGRRAGEDPFAARHGATHRALIEVRGIPMLERVLAALRAVPRIRRIAISTDAPEELGACRAIAARLAAGDVSLLRAAGSPAQSVLAALDEPGPGRAAPPLLLTTADHALLQPEMVERVLDAAADSSADLVAAFVPADLVRARFPGSRRTYVPFRDGAVSGANLYVLLRPAGIGAVAFWRRSEAIRKRPWRLAGLLGPGALLRFALRRPELDTAMRELSRAAGARIEAIRLPFAEAAVDVDREADLELAERILAAREVAGQSSRSPSSPKASRAGW